MRCISLSPQVASIFYVYDCVYAICTVLYVSILIYCCFLAMGGHVLLKKKKNKEQTEKEKEINQFYKSQIRHCRAVLLVP